MSSRVKALVTTRRGGPETLEVRELPDPALQPGHLRIQVAFAGLNFADVSARHGLYPDAPKLPTVMGYEVSGTVAELGSGVSGFSVGDRVVALTHFGGQAEQVVAPAENTFRLPDGVSLEVAAALPVNYLTAYHMLHDIVRLRPGDKVLIHSAAGGVGLAVVALCRLVENVEVWGTASASKHALLREAGLQHPIDYRTESYEQRVRDETKGRGLNAVLDPLGGADWKRGYGLLAPAGKLVCFGWSNMTAGGSRSLFRVVGQFFQMPRFAPIQLMDKNRGVAGVNLGHLFGETETIRSSMEALLGLSAQGKLNVRVDSIFPFAQGADAHRHLESRKSAGKVLLKP